MADVHALLDRRESDRRSHDRTIIFDQVDGPYRLCRNVGRFVYYGIDRVHVPGKEKQ